MKHNCLIYSRRTKPTSDHRQRYASNCNHAMQKAKPNNRRKRCSNYNRLAKCNHMKREPKTSNHRRARASTHRKLRSLFCISLTQHALREPNPPHVGRRDGAAGRPRQDQAASAPPGRRLLRLLRKARTSNCRKRCSDYNRLAKRNHMKRKPKTSNHRRA